MQAYNRKTPDPNGERGPRSYEAGWARVQSDFTNSLAPINQLSSLASMTGTNRSPWLRPNGMLTGSGTGLAMLANTPSAKPLPNREGRL